MYGGQHNCPCWLLVPLFLADHACLWRRKHANACLLRWSPPQGVPSISPRGGEQQQTQDSFFLTCHRICILLMFYLALKRGERKTNFTVLSQPATPAEFPYCKGSLGRHLPNTSNCFIWFSPTKMSTAQSAYSLPGRQLLILLEGIGQRPCKSTRVHADDDITSWAYF